ncbi:MAG TPA: hypothetical protein VF219_08115 [Vicinamibacterales bacterium]
MKPIEQARDWIQYVATGLAIIGGVWLHRMLEDKVPSAVKYLFIGCVLVVFFAVVEIGVRTCLNSSYTIRRLIMGAQDIEGWWADVILDPRSKEPMFGAVLRVDYEGGEYVLSGQDFNDDGSTRGDFTATQSIYSRYVLSYRFDAHLLSEPKPSVGGIGILNFMRRGDAIPIAFSGFLYEPHRLASLYIYGERIIDKATVAELRASQKQATEAGRRIALDYMKRSRNRFKGGTDSETSTAA